MRRRPGRQGPGLSAQGEMSEPDLHSEGQRTVLSAPRSGLPSPTADSQTRQPSHHEPITTFLPERGGVKGTDFFLVPAPRGK